MYPAHVLPPSPINPVDALPVQWGSVEVKWVGEVTPKEPKSIYANRNTLFKGHKRERERPIRQKEVADRMAGMGKRIAEWKAVSTDESRSAIVELASLSPIKCLWLPGYKDVSAPYRA